MPCHFVILHCCLPALFLCRPCHLSSYTAAFLPYSSAGPATCHPTLLTSCLIPLQALPLVIFALLPSCLIPLHALPFCHPTLLLSCLITILSFFDLDYKSPLWGPTLVGDAHCLGGVLWKHRRLLTAENVTNNFSRRYTTQQCQIQQATKSKIP
jgi:hypothetical protein